MPQQAGSTLVKIRWWGYQIFWDKRQENTTEHHLLFYPVQSTETNIQLLSLDSAMQSFPTLIGGYVYLEDVDIDETKAEKFGDRTTGPQIESWEP